MSTCREVNYGSYKVLNFVFTSRVVTKLTCIWQIVLLEAHITCMKQRISNVLTPGDQISVNRRNALRHRVWGSRLKQSTNESEPRFQLITQSLASMTDSSTTSVMPWAITSEASQEGTHMSSLLTCCQIQVPDVRNELFSLLRSSIVISLDDRNGTLSLLPSITAIPSCFNNGHIELCDNMLFLHFPL